MFIRYDDGRRDFKINYMNTIDQYIARIKLPDPYSHKGQNGKLLIVGGSELFHAASKWSLDIASKFVDMVFYSSVASNNELIKQAKSEFWNGIVIERDQLINYVEEADAILIGPGMERSDISWTNLTPEARDQKFGESLSAEEWRHDTERIVNYLVKTYPHKKWVIDAGALQMVVPQYLGEGTIITPHQGELDRLINLINQDQLPHPPDHIESPDQSPTDAQSKTDTKSNATIRLDESKLNHHTQPDLQSQEQPESQLQGQSPIQSALQLLLAKGVTILLKGHTDYVYYQDQVVEISGGNGGMTKGGTGDVLAGLVAALYCTNSADVAAVAGSFANKQAGENLARSVGPFFNASDLVEAVPIALWSKIESVTNQE